MGLFSSMRRTVHHPAASVRRGGLFYIPRTSHELTGQASDVHTPIGAMVAASGVGAIPQAEWRRGHNAGLSDTDQMMAISTGGYTFQKSFDKARSQQAADAADREAAENQSTQDKQVDAVRSAQPGSEYFDKAALGWRANQMNNLQGVFGNALRSSRYRLADQGLLGSGTDADTQRDNLAGYLDGRAGVEMQTGDVYNNLVDTSNAQRDDLVRQIRSGAVVDPGTINKFQADQNQLGSAISNIPAENLGSLFSQFGSLNSSNTYANGMGRGYGTPYQSPYGGPSLMTTPGSSTSSRGVYR